MSLPLRVASASALLPQSLPCCLSPCSLLQRAAFARCRCSLPLPLSSYSLCLPTLSPAPCCSPCPALCRPLLAAASVVVNKLKLLPLPEFQFSCPCMHVCVCVLLSHCVCVSLIVCVSLSQCVCVCEWRLEVCQNSCRFPSPHTAQINYECKLPLLLRVCVLAASTHSHTDTHTQTVIHTLTHTHTCRLLYSICFSVCLAT